MRSASHKLRRFEAEYYLETFHFWNFLLAGGQVATRRSDELLSLRARRCRYGRSSVRVRWLRWCELSAYLRGVLPEEWSLAHAALHERLSLGRRCGGSRRLALRPGRSQRTGHLRVGKFKTWCLNNDNDQWSWLVQLLGSPRVSSTGRGVQPTRGHVANGRENADPSVSARRGSQQWEDLRSWRLQRRHFPAHSGSLRHAGEPVELCDTFVCGAFQGGPDCYLWSNLRDRWVCHSEYFDVNGCSCVERITLNVTWCHNVNFLILNSEFTMHTIVVSVAMIPC